MANWQTALDTFVKELKRAFGPRLVGVVLYGSRARGDADEDSDVDTLIILDRCQNFWADFHRISPIASSVSLDNDVVISAIPIDAAEYEQRQSPLLINVRREGKLAA